MPADATTQGLATGTPLFRLLRMVGLIAICLAVFAQLARALVLVDARAPWLWYVTLGAAYLLVCILVLLRPPARAWIVHAALAGACLLVLAMLSWVPELDFITGLFVPLAFLAALFLSGRTMWIWVAALAALTAGSLMVFLGPLNGLALGLISVAIEVVIGAFVVVSREIETARRQSQVMLHELEETHDQLKAYSAQAGELAAVEERERVARGLNDSVARTLAGILAATQSARETLAATTAAADASGLGAAAAGAANASGPDAAAGADEAAPQLEALQAQTQQALAQMRGLIAELRPKTGPTAE